MLFARSLAYQGARVPRQDKPAEGGRPAAAMKDSQLKWRMCDCGPDYCGQCGLCDYGKEWLRRHPESEGEALGKVCSVESLE